jgi:ADP-dependent NAD(P)H-hydrate dehydratase / NAD(P)H-hydrate epimerase
MSSTQPQISPQVFAHLKRLKLPKSDSHKGQNGKLLIIGGSQLFHAASKWSLDVASHFVDMVFYASVPENNRLIEQEKGKFWNGIVIPRQEIENYLEEADCILIGPGMERHSSSEAGSEVGVKSSSVASALDSPKTKLSPTDWQENTQAIVNYLLEKYPDKKWVIDAGALQMVSPHLLNENCIITPHPKELSTLLAKTTPYQKPNSDIDTHGDIKNYPSLIKKISHELNGAVILFKGVVDIVANSQETTLISGGSPGMTKGGTGDVLAGLVAALYCTNEAVTAAVVGSYVNKLAGERLHQRVGPFFNATELVQEVPKTLWSLL